MCGIAGYLDLQQLADQTLIERMSDIMEHRGPDGEGYSNANGTSAACRLGSYRLEGRRDA